jgi:chromosomal replication initiation ATPase DnaA
VAYRAYVEEAIREGIEESPWEQVQGQLILGGATLKNKAQRFLRGDRREQRAIGQLQRRQVSEIIEVVSQLKGEAWKEYRDRRGDEGRDLVLWLARRYCGLRLRELGQLAGGLDYAAVSVAMTRFAQRMRTDRPLAKHVAKAVRMFNVEI